MLWLPTWRDVRLRLLTLSALDGFQIPAGAVLILSITDFTIRPGRIPTLWLPVSTPKLALKGSDGHEKSMLEYGVALSFVLSDDVS